jgi:hypothetical protein
MNTINPRSRDVIPSSEVRGHLPPTVVHLGRNLNTENKRETQNSGGVCRLFLDRNGKLSYTADRRGFVYPIHAEDLLYRHCPHNSALV